MTPGPGTTTWRVRPWRGFWKPNVFVRKGKRGRRYAGGGWVR
jgi:hypothetical protein